MKVQKIKIGSLVEKNDKLRMVTDVRPHGYPRTAEGKAAVYSLTFDDHWHVAYPVDTEIELYDYNRRVR